MGSAVDLDGATALHVAARNGHAAFCAMLLKEFDADSAVVDKSGSTVLHGACEASSSETVCAAESSESITALEA